MQLSSLVEELAHLTALDAPSGFEEPVLAFCKQAFGRLCDSVDIDIRGNLYAHRQGTNPAAPLVAVMTHADEIGLQITRVTNDGFLGFTKIGGVTDSVLPGSRVRIITQDGKVEGLVGVRPGHVISREDARTIPSVEKMYIDVGAVSAEEVAEAGIEPGSPAVFASPLTATSNPYRVVGKAIDNRAGILAQLKLAEHVKEHRPACSLVFIVTVEEEIGLRGAAVAAAHVKPDIVIAVDTVPAGGTPDVSPTTLPWQIGKGPILKWRETRGYVTHRPLREHFRHVAKENHIPLQCGVDTAGVTDASSAQQASGNIAALTIGLPRRYSHSAVEMLDLDDLGHLIRLLTAGIPTLDNREMLRRLK
ncbi:MAG: M20/M25/M40 family metallo-hydrolase [Planctomycetota bacterium]